MSDVVIGGTVNYGQVAGILMLESLAPRAPGDPGHAETFPFPVRYGVVRGLTLQDLVDVRRERTGLLVAAARALEAEGVSFVAADCGLFAPFQRAVADALRIPFLGSPLSLLPFIGGFLPAGRKIGLITGHTGLLADAHLEAAGADRRRLVIAGMEDCREFQEVVLRRGPVLHLEAMRRGALDAGRALKAAGEPLGAVVLECTNLVSFRADIQELLRLPVFDAVSLIELFADGFRLRRYASRFVSYERPLPEETGAN